MCDVIDGWAEVWRETPRRARKRHRCSVCQDPIAVGVDHVEVTSLYDGRWTRARAHQACLAFTRDWQLDVCGQDAWTIEPSDTPHEAIVEHLGAGDIGAAEAAEAWVSWMRARWAEERSFDARTEVDALCLALDAAWASREAP